MKRKIGISIFFILIWSCASATAPKSNGFDQICAIYTTAINDDKFNSLSTAEKVEWINGEIEKKIEPGPALKAYHGAMEVSPDEKYQLFKKAAELELIKNWDCPAMQGENF
jgi:hypothetical protein